MSIGGDSTLSTSIIPVNASGYSLQANFSSGGVSLERPVQDSEPNIRLAAFKPRSSSSAGDDKQASAIPGARPAATKGQPQSTTGPSKGRHTYHPYRQSSEQHRAAQSTASGSKNGSTSSEQSAMPDTQFASQSEGRLGEDTANGSFGGPLTEVTTTNAQGSHVVHMFPVAVIRVPVRTTNNMGQSMTTESLSTAAATASISDVITSINDSGSTVLQTSCVPAVEYTITNPEGSRVIVKSEVVPSRAPSAAVQDYPSPGEDRPASPFGSYPDDQSPTAAGNLQSGSPSAKASDIQHASEEQPQPNASEGTQAGQLESAQSSSDAGEQGYLQSPSEPGSDSGSSNTKSYPAFDQSSSASSTYNAFNVEVGSGYDQLANSGPAAIAENPNALARFVQDRLANQTDAQREASKSQFNFQFAKFVDDLFAAPASVGQPPGSQQTAAAAAVAAEPGSQQPPQDLANQTCSSLGEMHEQLITNVFFMETTIQIVLRQYTDVRDVIVRQCQ